MTKNPPVKLSPPDFGCARLLVVGDVMLDWYWHGSTSRISPEAPVPVVHVQTEETRVGGAGNVALNAAALGARVRFIGVAGHDSHADRIEELLSMGGVDCFLQRVVGSKTITKLRILSRHQQMIRADFEDHFPERNGEELIAALEQRLREVDAVVLSDYAKGSLHDSKKLISAARQAGKVVVVDPKGTDFERYRGATLITPNLSEFEAVVGYCESDAAIERKAAALCDAYDLEAVLITRSEKGMTLIGRNRAPLHLTTRAREVFDVTGAGDTVVATVSAALGAGLSLEEAVVLSNVAAGIVVAKLGTATVRHSELEEALRHELHSSRRRNLLTRISLLPWRTKRRADKQSAVST
ncbi:D-glycero-beta-D-manno-heptose-7-phosphate kinase [Paraburkholderia sp. USG1]|uniref:D-glycero-beta-D-manno-heptose-7-phosphate kinase n=1 Tax=Paraburkholderia sp. USG1 TaxID=2952268 RepID=UPI002864F593|nr:D-glycero-beta-D-manno-heptose-7-phosphate kinase [Paraburkholderia sp. USG1]MDR8401751.1 D-glycero-beta-D-manno-heptose-7-phosphate kinase [Paraburkholderia sp. USG1]